MRTSSMKFRTAVTTLVITVALAVPRADAKPTQSWMGTTRGAITTVTQRIQRFFGISSNAQPGDPIPVAPTDTLISTTQQTSKSTMRR